LTVYQYTTPCSLMVLDHHIIKVRSASRMNPAAVRQKPIFKLKGLIGFSPTSKAEMKASIPKKALSKS